MPKRILVVEDDKATLRLFVDAITAEGFEAIPERHGDAALRAFERERPDAVILDLLIPGLTGFDLAQRIRVSDVAHDTPIIMVSGIYKSAAHRVEATRRYAVTEYLVKPIRVEALYAALRKVFGAAYPEKKKSGAAAEKPVARLARPQSPATASKRVRTSPGLAMSDLTLAGDLAKHPFAEVFRPIYSAAATGALLTMRDDVKKIVYFQKGYPAAVRSNVLAECLGRVMVAERVISQDDCEKSVALVRESGRLQGAVLLEMGVISPQNLRWALERQLEIKLFDLFSWETGQYRFNARGDIPSVEVTLSRSPAAIVYEGVKRAMAPARLINLLLPRFDRFPVGVGEPLLRFQEMELDVIETAFVAAIDGRSSLREIVARQDLGPDRTLALLFSLIATGVIECRKSPGQEAKAAVSVNGEQGSGKHAASIATANAAVGDGASEAKGERIELVRFVDDAAKRDYFQILGVARDAPAQVVNQAYLKFARAFHPDRYAAFPPDIQELASSAYAIVSDAVATVQDPKRRADYIASLDRAVGGPGGPQVTTQQVQAVLQAEVEFQRGESLMRSRRPRDALEAFRNAAHLYPDEGEHHVMIGWALFQASPGDVVTAHEAQAHIKRGLQLNPKIDRAFVYLGQIHQSLDNLLAAEAAFEKALVINPENIEAQRFLRIMSKQRKAQPERRR